MAYFSRAALMHLAMTCLGCGGIERAELDGGSDRTVLPDSPTSDGTTIDGPTGDAALETGPDTLWYPDCDCDDYAAREAPVFGPQEARPVVTPLACTRGLVRGCQNGGWTIRPPSPSNIDCADNNENVNPNVAVPSDQAFEGTDFDWNCDGTAQPAGTLCTSVTACQTTDQGECGSSEQGNCWTMFPACGATNSLYVERCQWMLDPNTPQDPGYCAAITATSPRLRCL